jgi:lipopolysaccharide biosynthesis glycosyltransferase
MNVIITFNTISNPYSLSESAMESIKFACERWNCEHIHITNKLQPNDFCDMFTKLYLPLYTLNYKRCLYLDTDIFVKCDAPNPFEIFDDPQSIYVVRDLPQEDVDESYKLQFKENHLCGPWYEQCKKVLQYDVPYDIYRDWFFNAGMFIYSPEHHINIFKHIIDNINQIDVNYRHTFLFEQALLNYAFRYHLKDKLKYIDKTWNYMDPPIHKETMEGYIYHFTGLNYSNLKPHLNTFYKWKQKT